MKTRALTFFAVLAAAVPLRTASAQIATVTVARMDPRRDANADLAQISVAGPGYSREAVASRNALLIASNRSDRGSPIGAATADLGANIAYTLAGNASAPIDEIALVYSFTESAFCNTMPARGSNLVDTGTLYTLAVDAPAVLARTPTGCSLKCESGIPKLNCDAAAVPERLVARATPLLVRANGDVSLKLIRDDFNFLNVTIDFEFAPVAPFPLRPIRGPTPFRSSSIRSPPSTGFPRWPTSSSNAFSTWACLASGSRFESG